jgi:hypothetical protein
MEYLSSDAEMYFTPSHQLEFDAQQPYLNHSHPLPKVAIAPTVMIQQRFTYCCVYLVQVRKGDYYQGLAPVALIGTPHDVEGTPPNLLTLASWIPSIAHLQSCLVGDEPTDAPTVSANCL